MAKSMFSASWYRVADLKPQLRDHVEIHRQLFRGERWFIVQDHASGRFHRFTPEAYMLIGQMDGTRTVQSIWERAGQRLGEDLPTQDEVIQLLAQLYASDLMNTDVPPDVLELAHRSNKIRRRTLLQHIKNPMAVRVPLLDPDRFLTATLPLVRPIFRPFGFIAWLGLILVACVLAATHWAELTENVTDRLLTAQNIALIVLTYPVIKALHELGHGYAARSWGAEVHEMGVMFLVFMPLPYVDASSSSAFRSKWRRAAVAAAGIMVELSLAAIALLVWLAVEPGLVRACAFNVMLIAGVSTLLFNGNPLLRYDGYYVFADLIEVPNLATRSNKYIFFLLQRYLFGIEDADSGPILPSERKWLVFYGLASFLYRTFIMAIIVTFVASSFFFIGVVLAAWAVISMFLVPLGKGLWFLFTSPLLRRRRRRAIALSGAVSAIIVVALVAIPVPHGTVVKGTVWVPDQAVVYASADGFVTDVVTSPYAWVAPGAPLVRLRDQIVASERRIAEAEAREFGLRLKSVEFAEPVKAAILREQLAHAKARRVRLLEREGALMIQSNTAGRFILPQADDLIGRFVRKGDLLGYVADPKNPIVRVAIPQDDIGPVQNQLHDVSVRYAGSISRTLPATIRRAAPAASSTLASKTLSTEGGGDIPLDPRNPDRTLEKVFQLDLNVPAADRATLIGERVYVRFGHGAEPLADRIYTRLRQLFLSEFSV